MKGHIQIELKNEKSGKVDVYEQDNMVTSAVAKVLGLATNIIGAADSEKKYMNELLPVGKKALGGIFLFDGVLKEDIDNVHFPMDVHLTGSAGQTANMNSKLTGSLNAAESKETDNGYVNTWEFSTAQSNGVITSLALTHHLGGADPLNSIKRNLLQTGAPSEGTYIPVAYSAKKGTAYFIKKVKYIRNALLVM